jgi:hypothetical protein
MNYKEKIYSRIASVNPVPLTKCALNLFKDTYLFETEEGKRQEGKALHAPWQNVDIISSNCPVHIGVKLSKLGDNKFQCPKGNEIYKAAGTVSNQTNKDRYDLGIDIIKQST